uniref:Uncharacterized protein n=1 Tax=Timema douglasi TaxID=61478 RepID=A0A7R8Z5E4_TIMDO|nr:unnamed protein product [Timema douglasi]
MPRTVTDTTTDVALTKRGVEERKCSGVARRGAQVYYYNFKWKDYGFANTNFILDIVKVISFALTQGKIAIHCHAALRSDCTQMHVIEHLEVRWTRGLNVNLVYYRLPVTGARIPAACTDYAARRRTISDCIFWASVALVLRGHPSSPRSRDRFLYGSRPVSYLNSYASDESVFQYLQQ